MAIGVSSLSPPVYGGFPGTGAASQNPTGIPLGLRGAVSLGSGLRTGVTVVEHAIRVSTQLGEARDRAREAQLEAAQHEAEAADADEAARREELRSQAAADAEYPIAPTAPDDESTRQTIVAAVAAGQSGQEPPRGAFVDFSV